MRKIYLVRHARPDTGPDGRLVCLGRTDVPLSGEGIMQARQLAAFFKDKKPAAVYTSTLLRCKQTAEILVEGLRHTQPAVRPVEDFCEVDSGLWDGMEFERIREEYPEEYEARSKAPGRFVIPGGESLEMAGERFMSAFMRMNHRGNPDIPFDDPALFPPEGDILIVAHSGVLQAFLCLLTGKDIDSFWDYYRPYASVTVLTQDKPGEMPSLESFGVIP